MTTTACLPECREILKYQGQGEWRKVFTHAPLCPNCPRAPQAEAPDLTKIQCNCGRSPLHPVSAHIPAPQAEDGGKVDKNNAFQVDRNFYPITAAKIMTGAELLALSDKRFSGERDIWKVGVGEPDWKVGSEFSFEVRCGMRFYSAPKYVNNSAPQAEDGGKVGRKVCQKIPHSTGGGYMHDEEHDGPYDVDGVLYCGRCHSWYNNPADHGAPALSEQPRTAAGDGDSNCPEDLCDGVQHWFGDQPFSCPNVCLCADKPGPHTHSPSSSIEAERDALRAELAAAREEIAKMKTCRHEWGDPQTKNGVVKTCQLCGVGGTDCAAEKARADKAEERVRELVAILQTLKQRGFTTATWDLVEAAIKRVSDLEELIVSKRTNVRALAKEAEAIFLARQEQKDGGR